MLVRPTITFSGKVNPLRMSKLVTHKSQVTFTSKTKSQQPDHFVKCQASEYSGSLLIENRHVGVSFYIKKPHWYGLVPHKGLIVTLGIRNTLLFPSSIGELMNDFLHVPIFIFTIL